MDIVEWRGFIEQQNDIGSSADAFILDMEIENIRNYISYFETIHIETACQWKGSQKLENGAFNC